MKAKFEKVEFKHENKKTTCTISGTIRVRNFKEIDLSIILPKNGDYSCDIFEVDKSRRLKLPIKFNCSSSVKCCPDDIYNEKIGENIAFEKVKVKLFKNLFRLNNLIINKLIKEFEKDKYFYGSATAHSRNKLFQIVNKK